MRSLHLDFDNVSNFCWRSDPSRQLSPVSVDLVKR